MLNIQMNKVQVDFDERISEYVKEHTNENINIKDYIEKIVKLALELNNISFENVCISISSASKEEINKLNLEYRNIDRPTDVLSFPIFEREEIEEFKNIPEDKKLKEVELGDIVLCMDIIYSQSIEYGTGIIREVLYMITHGVCHLLGYDHIEADEKVEMRKLEEEILNHLGVSK